MPLRDDLLNPIWADKPTGDNLYYDPVRDKIKEALREEDDSLSMGIWQRSPKKVEVGDAIRLTEDALTKRTKDLWLVGWMIEAYFRREGFAVLPSSLLLLRQMQDQFWSGLHPQLDEDGDCGMRMAPLQALVNRLESLARKAPLTSTGLGYLEYQQSRKIGYEAEADSDSRKQAREQAIAEGKITAEQFDASVNKTGKAFYASAEESLGRALDEISLLDEFHEGRYRGESPSLRNLRTSLEEVKQVVSRLLALKRQADPDPTPASQADVTATNESEQASLIETPSDHVWQAQLPTAAELAVRPRGTPESEEDAISQLSRCAQFFHEKDRSSPIPYLLGTAVRWAELRKQGKELPGYSFDAPETIVRQNLRRFASNQEWDQLLTIAIGELFGKKGRAWLDLHRYIWRAASERGDSAIAQAVVREVSNLLRELPVVQSRTFDDDTPVANADTLQWIESEVLPYGTTPESNSSSAIELAIEMPQTIKEDDQANVPASPDEYELAMGMCRNGRWIDALALLVRSSEKQPSGRMRFFRRIQVAQLCLAEGKETVAYPLLTALWEEIERRQLEGWEDTEALAQTLVLLLKCAKAGNGNEMERERIFGHLCRLDAGLAAVNQV